MITMILMKLQCTMCILCSLCPFQPNKLREVVKKNGRFTVSLAVRGGGGQLPRLAWGKEVPKKRDFNFDCQYFGQKLFF